MLTGIVAVLSTFIYKGQTDMAFRAGKPTVGLTIMGILALGLIWIWAYKKSGHLLAPMIAHGGVNIGSLIYWILVSR